MLSEGRMFVTGGTGRPGKSLYLWWKRFSNMIRRLRNKPRSPLDDETLIELINKYQAEQRSEEVIWFYRHVSAIKPKVIVEIGVKEGGNLKILSTHLDKDGILIGMDERRREAIPWDMQAECPVYYIEGNSHVLETKNGLIQVLGGKNIDVLFIDGDHSCEGMLQDFVDYSPLVRDGGIIAVHDIFYLDPVAAAWGAIPGNDWYESPRDRSSIGIGFIKKG